MAKKERKVTAVEKKLIGVADVVITAAERKQDPTLTIPVRSLSNITFSEKKGMIEMLKVIAQEIRGEWETIKAMMANSKAIPKPIFSTRLVIF